MNNEKQRHSNMTDVITEFISQLYTSKVQTKKEEVKGEKMPSTSQISDKTQNLPNADEWNHFENETKKKDKGK